MTTQITKFANFLFALKTTTKNQPNLYTDSKDNRSMVRIFKKHIRLISSILSTTNRAQQGHDQRIFTLNRTSYSNGSVSLNFILHLVHTKIASLNKPGTDQTVCFTNSIQ